MRGRQRRAFMFCGTGCRGLQGRHAIDYRPSRSPHAMRTPPPRSPQPAKRRTGRPGPSRAAAPGPCPCAPLRCVPAPAAAAARSPPRLRACDDLGFPLERSAGGPRWTGRWWHGLARYHRYAASRYQKGWYTVSRFGKHNCCPNNKVLYLIKLKVQFKGVLIAACRVPASPPSSADSSPPPLAPSPRKRPAADGVRRARGRPRWRQGPWTPPSSGARCILGGRWASRTFSGT